MDAAIIQQAKALSIADKASLISILNESINEDVTAMLADICTTKEKKASIYLGLAGQVLGLPSISMTSRKAGQVLARQLVMKQLRDEGLTTTAIGKLMGKDHATVIHLVESLTFDIKYNDDLKHTWNEFQKMIK